MDENKPFECPLCAQREVTLFYTDGSRKYYLCSTCHLRFLSPCAFLSAEDEMAHYQTHENCIDDPAYRHFLSKLIDPLLEKLGDDKSGLDYGCGPGPALAQMMEERGHSMSVFDPFFFPSRDCLDCRYDFVTCSETAEHFHNPREEFQKLSLLVKPGGWLAVMTSFQTDDALFARWHYRQDPTHVVFYRYATFEWLAADMGWVLDIPRKDVVLMQKPKSQ